MIAAAEAARASAHAAWSACPASRKTEKARLASVLDAACKAVTAAKRAANPDKPGVDLAAITAAACAEQARRQAAADLASRVKAAARRYLQANEWPRCGQSWPNGAHERADEKLLAEHGESVLGEGWEQ